MKTTSRIILAAGLLVGLTLGVAFDSFAHGQPMTIRIDEQARRPWLGVYLQDVTADLVKEKGLKTEEGAYVMRVMKRSPADLAGIKRGDVVIEFDGRKIDDSDDLVRAVRRAEVGSKAKVVVMRGAEKKELEVTLRKYPRRHFARAFPVIPFYGFRIFKGADTQGLSLIELTPQLGKYFEAPDGKGVLVASVEEGSAAEAAGFKAGDVILKIANTEVENLRDIRDELSDLDEGEKVNVEILRKGSRMTLQLEIEESMIPGGGAHYFEFFYPGKSDWLEFRIPDIRSHLEKLRVELNHVRKVLEKQKKELERQKKDLEEQIRERLEKVRMALEV